MAIDATESDSEPTWYAFTDEPPELRFGVTHFDRDSRSIAPEGASIVDRGAFDAFHQLRSSGLSCASCHPGGEDDGHVWTIEGLGERRTGRWRTPSLIGLSGRAPYLHDGRAPDLAAVFEGVDADGGPHDLSGEEREVREMLFDYLEAL